MLHMFCCAYSLTDSVNIIADRKMMAGNTRKARKQCMCSSLLVMACLWTNAVLGDIGCLDNQGNLVDW